MHALTVLLLASLNSCFGSSFTNVSEAISVLNPFFDDDGTKNNFSPYFNKLNVTYKGCVTTQALTGIPKIYTNSSFQTNASSNEPIICAAYCKTKIRFQNYDVLVQLNSDVITCACVTTGEAKAYLTTNETCSRLCSPSGIDECGGQACTCGNTEVMSMYEPYYELNLELTTKASAVPLSGLAELQFLVVILSILIQW